MARWVRFRTVEGRVGFGTLEDNDIVEYQGDMFGVSRSAGRTLAMRECMLLSPCVPGKVVALYNNFHALAAQLGKQVPQHPLWFLKSSSSLVGQGEAIRRPDGYTGKIVFEGELGIVMGKSASRISTANAARHIFGYTCLNDVTAFDLLAANADFPQWGRAKGFDSFGPIGPAIATELEVAGARLVTRLDGKERQNYPLSDMIFAPDELVSRLSYDLTLQPGDVIACGTSVGVGSLKEGVTVHVEITGIGTLSNTLAPG